MGKIYLVSDWHFCHDREFIYAPRGFSSVEEMNQAIFQKHNSIVTNDDDVYVLGDLMLNNDAVAAKYIKNMNGRLHIILGNHDTDNRIKLYKTFPNVAEIQWATRMKYKGYSFYLSHFPTLTGNLEKESLKQTIINLYGHSHQHNNFYMDIPYMYHVGVDSHNCYPVLIDDIIIECEKKVQECIKQL